MIGFVNRVYLELNREAKRWIFRFIDIILMSISIYLAFSLRFDFDQAWERILQYDVHIYMIIPIKIIFFSMVGVYRPVLRYAGLEFLSTAFIATIGSTGILVLTGRMLVIASLPRSILILDSILTLLLLVSARVIIRRILHYFIGQIKSGSTQEQVIIYGAGETGCQLFRGLSGERYVKVAGFVDDNPQLQKQIINGRRVYSIKELPKLIKKFKIDSILLAMPSSGKQRNREIVNQIQHLGVQIKTIPAMGDIVSGKVSISEIRKIDIIDLLGREEVEPDFRLLQKNIKDKVVLVSGAGGSIGSELCRQILENNPESLILYELNEFALYNIHLELIKKTKEIEIIPILGSVLNHDRMARIIFRYRVKTIYHAAAYKHVPLVESNASEGVFNNIKGTMTAVEAAVKGDVETFVFISTDKAVRPANIMGATKRIAEMILQAFTEKNKTKTKFIMVRFGNVLDSNGSVVPLFRKQLAEGQNLTLTHKEITRYFMSIPEAARLVIQAGAMGEGGDVFLLEMGDPVKIYDLATQMIRLSGLDLGKDVDIEITGLRPGEKLYEELLIDKSINIQTAHPKIFCAKEAFIKWEELEPRLECLFKVAEQNNHEDIVKELQGLVPEFKNCTEI
jgi:FlaA1/EpsC-like NDP-sugar epimerase